MLVSVVVSARKNVSSRLSPSRTISAISTSIEACPTHAIIDVNFPPRKPKAEAPKVEAPKAEAPKAEAPKAEAPKAEAPKVEAPKAEAPKAEAPKAEAPKVEAPKAETTTIKEEEAKA